MGYRKDLFGNIIGSEKEIQDAARSVIQKPHPLDKKYENYKSLCKKRRIECKAMDEDWLEDFYKMNKEQIEKDSMDAAARLTPEEAEKKLNEEDRRKELDDMINSIVSGTSSWPPFSQNKNKMLEKAQEFKSYLNSFKEFIEFVDESYICKISGKFINKVEEDYNDIPELKSFVTGIQYVKEESVAIAGNSEELYDLLGMLEMQVDEAIRRLQSETDHIKIEQHNEEPVNRKRIMRESWRQFGPTYS